MLEHWSKDNSLIVLDDVPDFDQYYRKNIQSYLQFNHKKFKFIITSRQKPGKNIKHLDLDVLSPEAALELVCSLAQDSQVDFEQEKESLEKLCQWLGYLPLGLELVGRYLDLHPTYSIEKVIQKLEVSKLKARALLHPEEADMTGQLGIAAAFDLSWNEITKELNNKETKLAIDFQELASYTGLYESEPFIWSWVQEGILDKQEEEEIEKLEELRDRYLIKRNLLKINSNQQYQLHSLIAEYFKAKLEILEQANRLKQKFTHQMIGIARSIPEIPTQEDITRVALAIPHLSNVANELIDYAKNDNLIWAFEGLGRVYKSQGAYTQAEQCYQKNLQVCRDRFGQEHPDIAASLNNLALLYYLQGRYNEAEPLYLEALSMRRKLLEQKHPDIAASLNNLALLYESQGRYGEAEPLYLEALSVYRKTLGQDHPAVATSLNNLALLYESQGKYEEAESLFLEALSMRRKLLRQEHPDIAQSLNNLAELYYSQGRYSEAESLYLEALSLMQKLFGQEYPDIATCLNNLAELYYSQGRYSEAESLYLEALSLTQKLLGQEHPDIAVSLNNLALLYESQGRYGEAKTLYFEALSVYRKTLGQEHPLVATSLNNLAYLYKSQGRYEDAEPLYLDALEIAEKSLGKDHPNTNKIRENLERFRNK